MEYHLNMVGSEIMNRAFREEFLKTARKLVLLPSCLRLLPENRCNAVREGSTFRCICCTKECNVAKLSVLGKKHGFEVAVVPHESSLSTGSNDKSFIRPGTGVVGVACVLNLLSGGWMLREYGIAAQCTLLDYCGCKNHWHDGGLPTSLNTVKLLQIVNGGEVL